MLFLPSARTVRFFGLLLRYTGTKNKGGADMEGFALIISVCGAATLVKGFMKFFDYLER